MKIQICQAIVPFYPSHPCHHHQAHYRQVQMYCCPLEEYRQHVSTLPPRQAYHGRSVQSHGNKWERTEMGEIRLERNEALRQ